MTRIASGICLILAAVGFLLLADNNIDACAMVRSGLYNVPVEIAAESAIIIWDEANKTEHFIRRSSYKTEAKDFGFLVPTPSRPELAEAKDAAFRQLEQLTAAPIIYPPGQARNTPVKDANKVEVLEIKRVAGFDAAVLKANDAGALNDWLKANNYQSSPELAGWVEPYVKSGWIITAFKIASDAPKTKGINTSAVRMSFKTERPFYPYREPADQRPAAEAGKEPVKVPNRLLRVYVLAKQRMQANLGDKDWPGKTVWANLVHLDNCKTLAKHLQLKDWQPTGSWWLTELEDRSSPRPGTDELFFAASKDQSAVTRPPMIGGLHSSSPDDLQNLQPDEKPVPPNRR